MGEPLPTREMASYIRMASDRPSRLGEPSNFEAKQDMFDYNAGISASQEAEERRIEEMESHILGGIWDYFKYDTAPGALITGIAESASTVDTEFDPFAFDDFQVQNEWERNEISQAANPEHYAKVKERLLDQRAYKENLASMGYGQFGIMIAGEALNLTNYVLPGSGAVKALKGIKRVAAAGALQASVNTLETAVIDSVYQDRSATEYLATAAMGLGFGALFGGVLNTKAADTIEVANNNINTKARTYASTHMAAHAREATGSPGSVGAARLQADPRTLDPEFETRLRDQHIDVNDPLAVEAMIDASEGGLLQQKPVLGKVVTSQAFTTQTSPNILIRKIGSDLAEKPEARIADGVDKQTAALEVSMESERLSSLYAKRTDDMYKQFQQVEPEYKGWTNWSDLAFERLHRGEDLDRISPEGNKILKAWGDNRQAVWEDLARKANTAGVEEFQDLDKVLEHITRPYSPANIHKLTGEHGEESMVRLFQKALTGDGGFEKIYQQYVDKAVKEAEEFKTGTGAKQLASLKSELTEARNIIKAIKNTANPKRLQAEGKIARIEKKINKLEVEGKKWTDFVGKGIDVDEISYQMARQTMARMMKRATSPTRDANLWNTNNQTLIRKVVRDADMKPEVKDAILHIMDTQGRDVAGKMGAPRMHIDMSAEVLSPITGRPVRITEFFDTDTGAGQFQHMRYWVGRTAIANQGNPYKSLDQLAKNRDSIRFHGDAIGMNSDDITKDLVTYDSLISQLLGEPLEDMGSKSIRTSRTMRKMLQMNVMNKLGIPQLGESGRALAAVGNLVEGIPALAKLLTDIRANRISPEIVRNLEDYLFGKIGDDYIMNSSHFRGEDLGTKAGMIETGLNKLGYAQGLLSGWHFIHTAQRKFLLGGLSQKYYNDITRGKMSQVQMNNLGITPQMANKIKDNMLKHATDVTKEWGRYRPKNLHIENWEPDVARVFGQALHRKANNAIQGILIGEIPEFMTKEVGKILTQFRTFNIASVGKQTRRDVQLAKAGESEPYQAMMFQFVTAAMAVSLKIGWDATTSGDAENYLKDHLTVSEIARQALIYNGQVGWGVDVVDNAAAVALPEAWNPLGGRQGYTPKVGVSQLVPSVNYANKLLDGVKGASNLITGQGGDSKAAARAAVGWLPLENSILGDVMTLPLK